MNKHTFHPEEIRRKVQEMGSGGWTSRFRWRKAHVGTTGNELADKLAKEASSKTEINISCNRIRKSAIKRELEENSNVTWEKEWETTKKGSTTKEYFPTVAECLQTKINFTQNLTIIVTCHGYIKSYLHRFRILEETDCTCGIGNQTADHKLLECGTLVEERGRLIAGVAKTGIWPIKTFALIKRHYKAFARFAKTMHKINEINPVKKNNNF